MIDSDDDLFVLENTNFVHYFAGDSEQFRVDQEVTACGSDDVEGTLETLLGMNVVVLVLAINTADAVASHELGTVKSDIPEERLAEIIRRCYNIS